MTGVVLSLGSNLGDRRGWLSRAATALQPHKVSEVYETPPWGDDDQPTYLNVVMAADDPSKTPQDWLEAATQCQIEAGRVRDPERPYGPRILDVDLVVAFDREGRPIQCHTPTLTLPHPRAHLRAFVLVPWLSIDPEAYLPGRGRVRDLLLEPSLAAEARTLSRVGKLESGNHA